MLDQFQVNKMNDRQTEWVFSPKALPSVRYFVVGFPVNFAVKIEIPLRRLLFRVSTMWGVEGGVPIGDYWVHISCNILFITKYVTNMNLRYFRVLIFFNVFVDGVLRFFFYM